MAILEGEVGLNLLAPAALIVEVNVRPLLVLLRRQFGLIVPLKPGQKVFVVSPRLLLELARGQVLVGSALLEVEDEEERVRGKLLEDGRVVEDRGGYRGEAGRRAVRVPRRILVGSFRIAGIWGVPEARLQHRQLVAVTIVITGSGLATGRRGRLI